MSQFKIDDDDLVKKQLDELIEHSESTCGQGMSAWEIDFVDSLNGRMMVSDKQKDIIERIHNKLADEGRI